jgi:hypothetical protein
MNDMEMINLKLGQIRNDILGLHLCLTVSKMYEAGFVSKEEYVKILNTEYDAITKQITAGIKES